MSPTERSDEARRLKMARRLGSAMTAKVDSMMEIYFLVYMNVKEYNVVRRGTSGC